MLLLLTFSEFGVHLVISYLVAMKLLYGRKGGLKTSFVIFILGPLEGDKLRSLCYIYMILCVHFGLIELGCF